MKPYSISFALAALAMTAAPIQAAPRAVLPAAQEEFPIPKPQTFHHAFEYYRALPRSIVQNQALAASKLTIPVLAVGGGGNGGFGASQPENIRRYATNVEAHVLPGCGHWVPEECAPALDPLITSFLARP